MFSPLALKTYGQDGLAEHAAGTGPFRLVKRIHGERTELVRNDHYWGQAAHVERVVFRPIVSDSTRLAALQAGEIDILTRTPADAVNTLTGSGYTVPESAGAGLLYLGWNFKNRFAKQLPVRQAIIQAIDREGLAKTLFKGHADPAYNILNQNTSRSTPRSVTSATTLPRRKSYWPMQASRTATFISRLPRTKPTSRPLNGFSATWRRSAFTSTFFRRSG
ncbi:hypothetical protein CIC12_07815 [Burkholderia sp. SG-MS1]|nr:hypothetical protein [Paraburkholderia sp. SG-MS1]